MEASNWEIVHKTLSLQNMQPGGPRSKQGDPTTKYTVRIIVSPLQAGLKENHDTPAEMK